MRKYIVPAAVAASLAFGSLAMAATQHAAGTIKTYDAKAMTLTLSDGSTYMLPKSFKDPGLKAGDKVSVAWDVKNKHKTAETVTIAK
jgi:hypothetical protein